jgi:hypothetical protein
MKETPFQGAGLITNNEISLLNKKDKHVSWDKSLFIAVDYKFML